MIFKAELTEVIQHLIAKISLLIEQIPRRNESLNAHNDEHIGEYCKAKALTYVGYTIRK